MKETMPNESLIWKIYAPFLDTALFQMTPPKKTPVQVSQETIKAMIIDANESYCDEFDKGNKLKSMWWDGYLEALHRIKDYHEK